MGFNDRLGDSEDRLTERKSEGISSEDICAAISAFANSVGEGEIGVIFIGVADDGTIVGVTETDRLQKKVSRLAREHCYPPVDITLEVIEAQGHRIVAVGVPFSSDRPHFTGRAYIRVGSETRVASEKQFEELITSRTSSARLLLKFMADETQVYVDRPSPYDPRSHMRTAALVADCTPHYAVFKELPTGPTFSIPWSLLTVRWDGAQVRPLITEHVR